MLRPVGRVDGVGVGKSGGEFRPGFRQPLLERLRRYFQFFFLSLKSLRMCSEGGAAQEDGQISTPVPGRCGVRKGFQRLSGNDDPYPRRGNGRPQA